jgi:hypothetical protein
MTLRPLALAQAVAVAVVGARWLSRTIGCQMAMQGRIRQGRMVWLMLRPPRVRLMSSPSSRG